MNKPRIRIADSIFAHGTSLGSGDLKIYPEFFDWYRGDENINDVIVITESHFHLVDSYTEKTKIALIVEPPCINSESYKFIRENSHKFDYILTHQKTLIDSQFKNFEKKIHFYFFGGCWIEPQERKIYEKTKNISIIASKKRQTCGHQLRHEVIEKFADQIDVFGNGYKFIENKADGLRDYRYTIVIENEQSDYWITEKLIDAMQCGCIPIYWGCRNLREFFDPADVLPFSNIKDLNNIITQYASRGFYNVSINAVKRNFTASRHYTCPEDYMYHNFFSKMPETAKLFYP